MTVLLENAPIAAAAAVFLLGVAMVLRERHLFRTLMGLSLVESAVNLLLVAIGYRHGGASPIYTLQTEEAAEKMVLPTVQALTLTSIVIGLATTAMLLAFAVTLHRTRGTLDIDELRSLRG
ncbi:MAG: NADH-quinone oxidoreductase subunit K [Kiritimatiellae bacterium]|nr:NADH-quinone oxidoreductase subunit K [Kiritimatiellia bacterium]